MLLERLPCLAPNSSAYLFGYMRVVEVDKSCPISWNDVWPLHYIFHPQYIHILVHFLKLNILNPMARVILRTPPLPEFSHAVETLWRIYCPHEAAQRGSNLHSLNQFTSLYCSSLLIQVYGKLIFLSPESQFLQGKRRENQPVLFEVRWDAFGANRILTPIATMLQFTYWVCPSTRLWIKV